MTESFKRGFIDMMQKIAGEDAATTFAESLPEDLDKTAPLDTAKVQAHWAGDAGVQPNPVAGGLVRAGLSSLGALNTGSSTIPSAGEVESYLRQVQGSPQQTAAIVNAFQPVYSVFGKAAPTAADAGSWWQILQDSAGFVPPKQFANAVGTGWNVATSTVPHVAAPSR